MDLFDVHRRDVLNFDNYMDLKKPEFGGPDSAKYARDAKGKTLPKNPKTDRLEGYTRVVERDPMWGNPHYNSTYKAMTHDLVYKQAGKKPFNYRDPYDTGIPVVEVGEYEDVKESFIPTFEAFTKSGAYLDSPSNNDSIVGSVKATVEINDNVEKELVRDEKILKGLQNKEKDVLTEGACNLSFNKFIANEHFSAPAPAEVETEEEIEVDIPSTPPSRRPFTPNPPRRDDEELPGPRNLDSAVEDLANYLNISKEAASEILGIYAITNLEKEDKMDFTDDEEDVSSYIEIDDSELGAGPSCYGEGPEEEVEGELQDILTTD